MTGRKIAPKTLNLSSGIILPSGLLTSLSLSLSLFDRRTSSPKVFHLFVLRFAIWNNSTRPSRTKDSRPQSYKNSANVTRLTPRYVHFGGCLSFWIYLGSCFKCCMVEDLGGARDIDYIRKGMSELSVNSFIVIYGYQSERFRQDWDWRFGQTPEFTHVLQRSFSWGDVVSFY